MCTWYYAVNHVGIDMGNVFIGRANNVLYNAIPHPHLALVFKWIVFKDYVKYSFKQEIISVANISIHLPS